ncbi:MAG: hypothetical protein ACKVHR_15690 [Pirellulales bacterium]|jgi:hypothetical protein
MGKETEDQIADVVKKVTTAKKQIETMTKAFKKADAVSAQGRMDF